jgi:hypothetical protein
MDIENVVGGEFQHTSVALSQGKIRTNEEVKKDYYKLKTSSFYSHINPINYFKKEKPLFWNLWNWSELF